MTDPSAGASFRQSTLPFGKALDAESSGYTNQVFTSYDRSSSTGLDYAVNRTFSQGQSRFTQVDPIEMAAADNGPQSNNLYAYTLNQPTDFVDPSGLNEAMIFFYPTNCVQGDGWYRCQLGIHIMYIGGSTPSSGPDGGGGAPTPPLPKTNRCGAQVPADADSKSLLNTILGEMTGAGYIGTKGYSDSQAGSYPAGKVPAGNGATITYDTLVSEAAMLSLYIYARSYSQSYPNSVQGVMSDPRAPILAYQSTNNRLASYQNSTEGSAECKTLRAAVDGLNKTRSKTNMDGRNVIKGTIENTERLSGNGAKIEWRGVKQGNFIRTRGDATRVGNTDFMPIQ